MFARGRRRKRRVSDSKAGVAFLSEAQRQREAEAEEVMVWRGDSGITSGNHVDHMTVVIKSHHARATTKGEGEGEERGESDGDGDKPRPTPSEARRSKRKWGGPIAFRAGKRLRCCLVFSLCFVSVVFPSSLPVASLCVRRPSHEKAAEGDPGRMDQGGRDRKKRREDQDRLRHCPITPSRPPVTITAPTCVVSRHMIPWL